MQNVLVEEVQFHRDARGLVFEPVAAEQLPAQHNCHVVINEPGCVRGNHFHERGTEVSVVIGPALVRVRENGQLRDIHVDAERAMRFIFPPRISHAFKNTGDRAALIVSFNTTAFDRAHPDVFPDALIT